MIQKDEISNGVYQQNSGCHYKVYEVSCVQCIYRF